MTAQMSEQFAAQFEIGVSVSLKSRRHANCNAAHAAACGKLSGSHVGRTTAFDGRGRVVVVSEVGYREDRFRASSGFWLLWA